MDKFEKNIKEQLEKRELQPSDRVWASIDQRLNYSKTNRSNKRYFVYGIAAGVLIIFGIFGIIRLNNGIPINDTPQIVYPVDSINSQRELQIAVNKLVTRKPLRFATAEIQVENLQVFPFDRSNSMQSVNDIENEKSPSDNQSSLANAEDKVSEEQLLYDEVNLLLEKVNKKRKSQNKSSSEITQIDPNELIEEVELEIESESIKKKIIIALENKINKAKDALTFKL